MNKKLIFPILLSLALVLSTLGICAPVSTISAATVWNNRADVSWIDSNKKIIAFAFDDGPVSYGTSAKRILDTLEQNKAHATFFYQGNLVNNGNQSEIQRAYRIGCEIANHTWTHGYLTNMSSSQIQDEVNKTTNLLRNITGDSSAKYLVRPPYLATNQTVFNAIDTPLITCSVDTQDWAGASKDQIIQRVLGAPDGTILLMHETYDATADAVAYLVPELQKRGFAVTSISELFKMKGKDMYSGQVYTSCSGKNISNPQPTVPSTPTPTPYIPNTPTPTPYNPNTPTPTPYIQPSTPSGSGNLPTGITCTYKVVSDWGSGYQAEVTIKNASGKSFNGWNLSFTLGNKIASLWGAELVGQSGSKVTVKNPSWDTNLPNGGSVTVYFVANGSSSNAPSSYSFQ